MEQEQRLSAGVIPLLGWYNDNARVLPWRSQPTPYRVWVSEIMLQQTRVAAVMDYFRRFMEALPTVADLAACPEERLMKLWQGLGYYSRARNLQKAAQMITGERGGDFPATYPDLLALPGVGEYTAGAVASIAFGEPVPAVDGNVLRVVTRLLGDSGDITRPDTKGRLRELLGEVIPLDCPGTFNQALMELGALICLPNGAPLCHRCPWGELCLAHQRGQTDTIPVKPPKKPRRVEERTVFLIINRGRIALRQRPARGLLAGLWEFPNQLGQEMPLDAWGICPESAVPCGQGKHIFTHLEWHMTGVEVHTRTEALPEGWVWATPEELRQRYPIPNAFDAFRGQAERITQEENCHDL